jgi:hypothetical protein
VLFIADSTTVTHPDHPVLVVDLLDDDRRPLRSSLRNYGASTTT